MSVFSLRWLLVGCVFALVGASSGTESDLLIERDLRDLSEIEQLNAGAWDADTVARRGEPESDPDVQTEDASNDEESEATSSAPKEHN